MDRQYIFPFLFTFAARNAVTNMKENKSMKQIAFLITAILLTTGMVSAQQTQSSGASIVVTETEHDFGDVKESAGNVSYTFTVKNEGTAPLVLTRVVASCGCTTPEWTREPIAPGKTGKVTVTYNPAGRPGSFTKTISIFSNGKSGSYQLFIRGNVV
jgi:hypothetical protein